MPLALTGSPEADRESRTYKDVQELLLLHRHYEQKAMHLFRKGLSVEETSDVIRRSHAQLSSKNSSFDKSSTDTREKRKDSTTHLYFNDRDYLKQLLLKDTGQSVDFVDCSLAPKRTDTHSRTQLRLPKLDSIPPENKEIFYTTLPKMPPLPKLKEKNVPSIKLHGKKKRNRQASCNESRPFSGSAEKCLSIRQLPRDHFMLRDYGGSTLSSMLKVPKISRSSRPSEIELNSEGSADADKGCVWIVPVVNIDVPPYRLENWKEIENEAGFLTKGNKHSIEKQQLQVGLHRSERKENEDSEPKYKRNVHFSEFLHEIHLYSPNSTSQSARSNEGI